MKSCYEKIWLFKKKLKDQRRCWWRLNRFLCISIFVTFIIYENYKTRESLIVQVFLYLGKMQPLWSLPAIFKYFLEVAARIWCLLLNQPINFNLIFNNTVTFFHHPSLIDSISFNCKNCTFYIKFSSKIFLCFVVTKKKN